MPLTPEQLALRKNGIGASEIGAVAGLNPHAGPLDVWVRKVGLAADERPREAADWGNRLEPVIAQAWAEREGVELAPCDTLVDPEAPWMMATPDRLIVGQNRILEVKAPGLRQAHRWGETGTDQIPEEYLAQAMWQARLVRRVLSIEVEHVDFAVLIGGQEFRSYRVTYDEGFADELVSIGFDFWTLYVVPRVQPDPAGSREAAAFLARRYPRHVRPLLVADAAGEAALLELRAARAAFDVAEEQKADAEARVKALIGDAEGLEASIGRVTWRANKDGTKTDWEAVAREAGASAELVEKHTQIKPGARVLRCAFKEQ